MTNYDEQSTMDARRFRVLVTGSRNWSDHSAVRLVLNEYYYEYRSRLVIVHGACPTGVDAIADAWCPQFAVAVERFPADWCHYGRQAGPIRNIAMVATQPDRCLAFIYDKSPGASHCAHMAQAAGIPTTVFGMNGGLW